jgi:hypothetical protein
VGISIEDFELLVLIVFNLEFGVLFIAIHCTALWVWWWISDGDSEGEQLPATWRALPVLGSWQVS